MSILAATIDHLHGRAIAPRRARVLAGHVVRLLPAGGRTILDVGCGDGAVGHCILAERPSLSIIGLEVRPRPATSIAVRRFDGVRLPYADRSHDVVLLIDVLHQTTEAAALLRDAVRVAARAVIVKDHLLAGLLAGPVLRGMDRVGNRRHGVPLPYAYWTRDRWRDVLAGLGVEIEEWAETLGLYRRPLGLLCDRSLHFIARLAPPRRAGVDEGGGVRP